MFLVGAHLYRPPDVCTILSRNVIRIMSTFLNAGVSQLQYRVIGVSTRRAEKELPNVKRRRHDDMIAGSYDYSSFHEMA